MITLSLGRREQGKTTLAYFVALKMPTRVVFDPRKQFKTSQTISLDGMGLYEELDSKAEVIVQPVFGVQEVFRQTCDEVMQWITDNPGEPVALLVDEARFVDTPSFIPDSFDFLMRCTSREDMNIIMTAHRPVDISVDIRAIADFWAIFHTTQEHDLKVIAERCGNEVADIVAALPPRHVVMWDDSTGTYNVYREPDKWFADIKFLRPVPAEGKVIQ